MMWCGTLIKPLQRQKQREISEPSFLLKKTNNSVQTNKADESILVEYEAILAAAKEVHVEDEEGEVIIPKNSKPAQEKLESEVQNWEIKIYMHSVFDI